jgi:hypothetical protein
MTKKTLSFSIIFLILFSQTIFVGNAAAQTGNARYFNERFVVRDVGAILGAEVTYSSTIGNGNLGSLNDLRQAGFIDSALASGDKYGYSFALVFTDNPTTPARFYVTATPHIYRKNGRNSFYIDENGEMHGADKNGAAANASDPLIDSCAMSGISNEGCTIRDLRNLHGAQITYQSTTGSGDFGSFSQLYAAGLINRSLATQTNHGYNFRSVTITQTPSSPASFKIVAVPVNYGVTGFRSFYIDLNGVILGADKNGQPADENDPPINN